MTDTLPPPDEREAFEAWLQREYPLSWALMTAHETGLMWDSWQARAALPAAQPTAGVAPVEAPSRTAIDEIFDEAVSAAATANTGRPKEVSWVQAASDLANDSGVEGPEHG
jgi:hypothetical protein